MNTNDIVNGHCAVALGIFLLGGGAVSAENLESSVDSSAQNTQNPQNTQSQPSVLEKLLDKKQNTNSKGAVVYDLGQIEATAEASSVDYNAQHLSLIPKIYKTPSQTIWGVPRASYRACFICLVLRPKTRYIYAGLASMKSATILMGFP